MKRKQIYMTGREPRPLNAKIIESLGPNKKAWDSVIPGLHAHRTRGKTTPILFKLEHIDTYNRRRTVRIGNYGAFDVTRARSVAMQYLFATARGANPEEELAAKAGTPTILQVSMDYMREVVIPHRKRPGDYEHIFASYIRPELGVLKIDELTHEHLIRFHGSLRRKPYIANMAVQMLATMYGYAARRRMVSHDFKPWLGLPKFKEQPRKRYATPEEMERIAQILIRKQAEAPRSVAFIMLLIMTGARKSEIANATLKDLHGNRLELKNSKTGFRVIYLSDLMLQLIEKIPRVEGDIRLVGIRTPEDCWYKIRKEAGCPDLRLHDLRHSFASQGLAAGLSLETIGQLLGHKAAATTKRYAHLVEDRARVAVEQTTDAISALMKGAAERIVEQQDRVTPPLSAEHIDIYKNRTDIPEGFKKSLRKRRDERLKKAKEERLKAEKVRKRKAAKAERERLRGGGG